MPVIALIGPSGIGKTTLGRLVAERMDGVLFFDTDEEIKKSYNVDSVVEYFIEFGARNFLNKTIEVMTIISRDNPNTVVLCAVGAGAFRSNKVQLLFNKFTTLNLTCRPTVLYERWSKRCNNNDVTFEQYMRMNCNGPMTDLYSQASGWVSADLETIDDSVIRIMEIILELPYTILNTVGGISINGNL